MLGMITVIEPWIEDQASHLGSFSGSSHEFAPLVAGF